MSYKIICPCGAHSEYKTYAYENMLTTVGECRLCYKPAIVRPFTCSECHQGQYKVKFDYSFPSTSDCLNCGAIKVFGRAKQLKKKRNFFMYLLKQLIINTYPKLMWAPGKICEKCSNETMFYEFNKTSVKEHCSMCGEQ